MSVKVSASLNAGRVLLVEVRRDLRRAIAQLDREDRVPVDLLERLLAPLPPAIHGQRETLPLKRLDEEVGDRALLRVVVQQLGIGGAMTTAVWGDRAGLR
jgi:hypothetical protein